VADTPPLADDFLALVGARIRARRRSKGVTVQQLADEAGISRRQLTDVEQGHANPTLVTVTRIARALGTDFTELLEPADSGSVVDVIAPQGYTQVWSTEAGSSATLLVATPGARQADLWRWWLAPDEAYQGQADPAGSYELFSVLSGTLTIETDDGRYAVDAGSSARLRSDRAYAYRNAGEVPVLFVRVVALAR